MGSYDCALALRSSLGFRGCEDTLNMSGLGGGSYNMSHRMLQSPEKMAEMDVKRA